MQRDNIWDGFTKLFPDYKEKVESYRKVGSKTLKLKMKTDDGSDKFLFFLYNDPWDWTFGSKVWRTKPRKKVDFSEIETKCMNEPWTAKEDDNEHNNIISE